MKLKIEKILLLGILICSESIWAQQANLIRGPYLQSVSGTSAVIRWRTEQASSSQVHFGKQYNKQSQTISQNAASTEHEIKISNLKPNTKYYYSIGTKDQILTSSVEQFVKTAPSVGSKQPIRIWALGDFGSGTKNQMEVLSAAKNFMGTKKPDVWIWLGDNAYENGKDEEYQKNVFDIYQKDFLQQTALYPSPGNHDYAGKHDSTIPSYFKIFNLPINGEAGGVPSGTEAYYSFDYGNVHLISLNTEDQHQDGTFVYSGKGAQFEWLEKDLKANKLPWIIVYFHKPPYTKGSHDSDKENDLILMRQNVTNLFQKYKVDIVIAGHSHVYERTYPIKNHTGTNSTFEPREHIDSKSSKHTNYNVGKEGQGVIYIVCGSGGKVGGQKIDYPLKSAVYSNNTEGGSMIFDIRDHILEAKWIASNGQVLDKFSIIKK